MNTWICDNCGKKIPFNQPELPASDIHSEINKDKDCPVCDNEMVSDDIEVPTTSSATDSPDDIEVPTTSSATDS